MRFFLMIAMLAWATIAGAEDRPEGGDFRLGLDAFHAGSAPIHAQAGADDLFMAGETVRVQAPIEGTAHLAGRRIELEATIGDALYAAGMDLELRGAIDGDATVSAYSVDLREPVGGDLRVWGANVTLAAPVAGNALIGGDRVEITGTVAGDVLLSARSVTFGPEARIDGALTLVAKDPDAIEVPASVIPAERITREVAQHGPRAMAKGHPGVWGAVIVNLLGGIVLTAALAALIAGVWPGQMARLRETLLDRTLRAMGVGFLGLSSLIGATVLLALTVIGLIVAPAAAAAAFLLGAAGYIIAVYAFGVGLLKLFGRAVPDSLGDRALAAVTGAVVAGLIGIIPFLGWLFVLALSISGAGALVLRIWPKGAVAVG
ncbi:hypothetical protein [Rhodovulum adriaticum]|uniref:DUF8173 domain-containing protein n=1 Tax=Rhodovulum adriaticum TaxID=35804 RepID=A0A4R2NW84_RHOAD|nr:hypothetical protein [Rhodovulum adriaticum]MBK1635267.1 hypothetical protein [Rhodovulum adriaticum]TCP26403.1 hypothetical protein EV656_102369 [Rhodovulum adriaticum]